ncbi:MAG: aminotransferase class IV [Acidimicrobiia bacterium]|nr:aminotransferase class IV [Acidimicrobiia bacterium]
MIILIDGERGAALPVTDSTVVRGDGVFEAVRSYGGQLFALDDHLSRLTASAAAMHISLPDDGRIGSWARSVAAEGGDGIVRVIVSRGDVVPGTSGERRIVVMHHPTPYTPSVLRLRPWAAPWHPSGRAWELAGIKTTSYAPNLRASRSAAVDGFDDALLTGVDGVVLEGPTFAVGWVQAGTLRFPALELGILDSITRRHVETLARANGIDVEAGRYTLEDVAGADEVLAVSTVKEVVSVVRVGDAEFRPGPVTANLRELFRRHVTSSIRAV